MRRYAVLLLALLASPGEAQLRKHPQVDTFANLPVCGASFKGRIQSINDATANGICTGGGGSATAVCKCDGTSWIAVEGGGATPTADWEWDAWDLNPDGKQCRDAVEVTINSGPAQGTIECSDDVASIIYGSFRGERYVGGTLVFSIIAVNQNASPAGILDFDFSAICRGNSDLIDATWGSAANAAITFTTQNDLMVAATAAVTPNGTCAAGDTIFFRMVMDATATTTQVADTKLLKVTALEQ